MTNSVTVTFAPLTPSLKPARFNLIARSPSTPSVAERVI